jgi:predicted  nucleic acid-binding Zn-ribbon protein
MSDWERNVTDIAKHLRWCAVHGAQLQAIKAMEQGADEIDRLRSKLSEVLDELSEVLDENDRLNTAGIHLTKRAKAAEAEIERLRAALTEIANNENGDYYDGDVAFASVALEAKP